jgi:polar amino acid transport system permease protein
VRFDFELVISFLPRLLEGLLWTLGMSAGATIIAAALGLGIALLYRLKSPVLRALLRVHIELMRGMPILVVLFLLYYAGPSFGLRLEAPVVGVLGLGLYGSAYFAEVFRSGLDNIPRGQIEASRMLGLSPLQIIARIEIPQAIATVMPSLVNQTIMVLKESAVLSVITVPELTSVTTKVVTESFRVTEPFLAMAVLYWMVIETLSRVGRRFERRLRRHL